MPTAASPPTPVDSSGVAPDVHVRADRTEPLGEVGLQGGFVARRNAGLAREPAVGVPAVLELAVPDCFVPPKGASSRWTSEDRTVVWDNAMQ